MTLRRRIIPVLAAVLLAASPGQGSRGTATAGEAPAGRGATATDGEPVAVIERFVAAIDDRRVLDALAMLDRALLPDAKAEEAWLAHFAAIRSIHVMAMEPAADGDDDACRTYKVTLEAYVEAGPAGAPIPFYGWHDNPNIRWIRLCPDGAGSWRVSALATGP